MGLFCGGLFGSLAIDLSTALSAALAILVLVGFVVLIWVFQTEID